MREHKFRAWDKKRKEWLGVNLQMSITDGLLWWQFGFGCKPFSMDECRDIELMQYTGLKDMNGNEIYEGDVLKEKGWGDEYDYWCYGVIDFHNGCFQIEGSPLFEWLNESADFLELEVVGNIHENPELMEEVAKLQK